ncbi:MAG: dockerin type I repeat-containing protein, partial [Ruminococcus sp.]|nr:dockerin type I repeat-containing protein [Ruminococcus sp.]
MAGGIMNLNRITAVFAAVLTAFIPYSSYGITSSEYFAVCAEEAIAASTLPDWMPTNYEDALDFRNRYGATHIGFGKNNDIVCFVFLEDSYDTKQYEVVNTNELPTVCYHDIFRNDETNSAYEVIAYKNADKEPADFDVKLLCSSDVKEKYSFTSVGTQLIETDICSWLPDCVTEYKDFAEKNGEVSVKDNYVVFCLDSNAGTAYDWFISSDSENLSYLKYISSTSCNEERTMPLDGGQLHNVVVYQAQKDGRAKIGYDFVADYGTPYRPEDIEKTLTADCFIYNNAETVLLAGQTRITVVDEETGELLSDDELEEHPLNFFAYIIYIEAHAYLDTSTQMYTVTKNRSILEENYICDDFFTLAEAYQGSKEFYFKVSEPEVTYYENGAMDLLFKNKKPPTGDVNGDKLFSIEDLVLLQKWLLGAPKTELFDCTLADLNKDNAVDIFDLCLMRKALLQTVELPVAINISITGGYECIHLEWKAYSV